MKNDILLVSALLVIAVLFFIIYTFRGKPGTCVNVIADGEKIESYSLFSDIEKEIITADGGKNTLVIKDGKAYVKEANCPDKVCRNHAPVTRVGQTIICLPNKLVIEIE